MPTGDSISRFDSSRDMFNVRTSPVEQKIAARSKSQGITAGGKDTIQTQRVQPRRLGPLMILTRGSAGSGGRAVKIARAGRFVFFALALPPFLLLYSIPKWVVVNVIPQMYKQIEKGFDHAKKFFTQVLKMLTGTINSPFRNLLGRIKWRLGGVEKQNASHLSNNKRELLVDIGVFIYRVGAKVAQTFTKVVARPLSVVKEKIKYFTKAKAAAVASFIEKIGMAFKEKVVVRFKEKVTDKVKANIAQPVVAKVKEITQPMVNWIISKANYATHKAKIALGWGREKVIERAKAIKQALLPKIKEAQRIYESIQATVVQKAHAFSLQIVQVAQPVINLCIPTMQFLKKHLSFGIGWLMKKPKEQYWNMHKRAQKFIKGVSPYVKGFYETSNQILIKMGSWFIGPFLRFLAKLFPFVPWMIKWIGVFLRKAFDWFKKRGLHYLMEPIKRRIVSVFNFLFEEIKSLLKAPGAYLLKLLRKVLNLTLKAFKFTAIVLIGIGLIFKYWVIMLFELSDELGGWIQQRQNSRS